MVSGQLHSLQLRQKLFAKNANVKKLILTHFSSRYDDLNLIKNEAKINFENVHVAQDLDVINVRYADKERSII